jgi:hypothetical protein
LTSEHMTSHIARQGRLRFFWVPVAFLIEGILLYTVLAWLADAAADPFGTLLLALGNLGLSRALLLPALHRGPFLPNKTTARALLGRSVGRL